MKRILLAAALAMSIAGCTPMTGVQAPASAASAAPLDSRIGVALREVTQARKAATALATAGKITWAQDDQAQAALTLVRASLDKAQGLTLTDPAQAAQLLADALNALAAYQLKAAQ